MGVALFEGSQRCPIFQFFFLIFEEKTHLDAQCGTFSITNTFFSSSFPF